MNIPIEIFVSTLISEAYSRRNVIFVLFAVISLTFLTVGVSWPKKYSSFAIIHVDERNILQSLMQGTAATTLAVDHAANAREIIFGEKIMANVLVDAGWIKQEQTKLSVEKIKQLIKKNTSINIVGESLLKIEYQDSEPMRTYTTAKRMAELFIGEGEKAKSRESKSAYDFIDQQVNEYLVKLTEVEEQLRRFHSDNPDARPGLEEEVSTRITTLQSKIEQTRLELREAVIRRKSLKEQLSGETATTVSQTREGKYRQKVAELQEELEVLKLDYHETYPDVIRLQQQIRDLNESLENEITNRKNTKEQIATSGEVYVGEVRNNPVYQQLRAGITETDTQIATLKTRISEMNKMLENEYARARKIFGGEATLAQLSRNYQVNQEIYQDLLRRRENARVSKSLDQEQKGLTFSIQEPAKIPIIPKGMRFIHFIMIGIILGIAIPIGLVYMLLNFDPRVRFSNIITNQLDVPVIAEIPRMTSFSDDYNEKVNLSMIGFGVFLVFVVYAVVGWLKFTGKL